MNEQVDKIIIGAGIYGLYAALYSSKKGEKVIILEYDNEAISRATYINQARVHNGYHYPRSYSTAIKSAKYFNRFNEDFSFAINKKFEKIYATSKEYSWTSGEQFKKFCKNANIRCEEINADKYFSKGMVDGAFITQEYTFDAMLIKKYFIEQLRNRNNVEIVYNARINSIEKNNNLIEIVLENKEKYRSDFVLNATYSSTNQISSKFNVELFKIKYEICEIILCKPNSKIENIGITVMDGPFFSVMPFGKTGLHSLTSVTFTPHTTSYDALPKFDCQISEYCSPNQLGNCNLCKNKPKTSWNYMYNLSKKYLNKDIDFEYKESLFAIKPILMESEIDDSRPTLIRTCSNEPKFISVLSGKINTVYDLDEVL